MSVAEDNQFDPHFRQIFTFTILNLLLTVPLINLHNHDLLLPCQGIISLF